MRRLLSFLLQLAALALVIFVLTAAWIVFDGLNDVGDKADVALFASRPGAPIDPQLQHLAKLYKDGAFTQVMLCERTTPGAEESAAEEVKYLEDRGIPAAAFVETITYSDPWELARKAVGSMKMHEQTSVMLVTEYYHMTRLKIALSHEGALLFAKSHLGTFKAEDAYAIGREVVALYDYLGQTFVLPTAEKLKKEAQQDADKAQDEAHKAKDRINKDLDNLPK